MMLNVRLRSSVLMDAVSDVDTHIVELEQLVKGQREEIETLRKTISDRDSSTMQDSWGKVGRTLSLLLDHSDGVPPINDDLSLDTVLILKHIHPILLRVKENMHAGASIRDDIMKLEGYVSTAMEKMAVVSKKCMHPEVTEDIPTEADIHNHSRELEEYFNMGTE